MVWIDLQVALRVGWFAKAGNVAVERLVVVHVVHGVLNAVQFVDRVRIGFVQVERALLRVGVDSKRGTLVANGVGAVQVGRLVHVQAQVHLGRVYHLLVHLVLGWRVLKLRIH